MRRFDGGPLVLATSNPGKISEFAALLAGRGVRLLSGIDCRLESPEETGSTFAENARLKAVTAARATGMPALADDSGLCIGALGGRPGVRTAEFAARHGVPDHRRAMAELVGLLQESGAARPWVAEFVCALVLAWPDGEAVAAEGAVSGEITWPPRGGHGHGYDPFFVPSGEDRTLAEIAPWQKNVLSHRRRALDMLVTKGFT